jgi:hypothetical protein
MLGFGSSSYPTFCGAASQLSNIKDAIQSQCKGVNALGQYDFFKGISFSIPLLDKNSCHGNGQYIWSKPSDV